MKKYFLHVSLITLFVFTSCSEDGITKSHAVDVIAVTPLQSAITIGETIQFTAEALDIDLNPIVGVDFEWKSSNTDAVSIDETGLATGKAMDRDVIITVTADAIESNDAMIHVAGDPAVIEIPVTAEAVLEGKTIQVFGSIKDELGTEIPDAEIENW
ncbi:MAG: Ig-like domain-containing protein, partial [Candidatus Marinimicrobia bacterium]|nr:Ig-like domain-containing protein [Candidatus Neomarinimicrobiota bacterium]